MNKLLNENEKYNLWLIRRFIGQKEISKYNSFNEFLYNDKL